MRRLAAVVALAVLCVLGPAGAVAIGATASGASPRTATTDRTAATTTAAVTHGAATTTAARTTMSTRPPATTTTITATATVTSTATHVKTTTTTTTTTTTARKQARRHKAAPVIPITGWLGGGTTFPARALVLAPPPKDALTQDQISLLENSSAVRSFTLTPVASARPGDFGLMLAVDQGPAMGGTAGGLPAAMSAVDGLSSLRSGGQQLGLIAFDADPTLLLPLTASEPVIQAGLAATPWTGSGSDPALAQSMAIRQLSKAGVALGAVVLISDGAALDIGSDGSAGHAVQVAAAAAHTQLITIGVEDQAATTRSLQALQKAAPGTFIAVKPAALSAALDTVYRTLAHDYVLRYRSHAGYAKPVSVTVAARGVPGIVNAGYVSPAAPVRVARVHHRAAPRSSASSAAAAVDPPSSAPSSAPSAGSGFWSSSASVLAVAAIVALLLAATLALLLFRPTRRAVRTRVGSFIPVAGETPEDAPQPRKKRGGPFAALGRGSWWPPFVEAVAVARLSHTPAELVRRAAAAAVLCSVVLFAFAGSELLAVVALFVWPFALRKYVNRAAEKQRRKFCDTLPSYLQDLASSIRVGRSFIGALGVIAESADEPTRSEFERAVTDEQLGRSLDESLEAVAKRMKSSDMDQVALIAELARRSGSNLAESLDRVAEGSRERADVRREMRALTAQAKMSSLVLTCLPGVMLLGMSFLAPQYAKPLLHTTMGQVMIGVGAVMVLAGWKVMSKITRVEDF